MEKPPVTLPQEAYDAERLRVCVVAGINGFFVPRGTVLGICTFLVLARPSVKLLFNPNHRTPQ